MYSVSDDGGQVVSKNLGGAPLSDICGGCSFAFRSGPFCCCREARAEGGPAQNGGSSSAGTGGAGAGADSAVG